MTSTVDIELLANLPKGKKPPLLSPFVKPASEPKPPKSAILIYNPAGGKKKAARLAERLVLPMLKEAGVQVETRATERQGHAGEMGRTLPLAGVDALLVMGGDGTLSELLDGLQLASRWRLPALGGFCGSGRQAYPRARVAPLHSGAQRRPPRSPRRRRAARLRAPSKGEAPATRPLPVCQASCSARTAPSRAAPLASSPRARATPTSARSSASRPRAPATPPCVPPCRPDPQYLDLHVRLSPQLYAEALS